MDTNKKRSILRKLKTGLIKNAPLLLFLIAVICAYIGGVGVKEKKEQTLVVTSRIETLKDMKVERRPIEPENVVTHRNLRESKILPEYEEIYKENTDFIGWLSIRDTSIDYPVMQKVDDEDYYLNHDFDKQENINGCLIMDADSVVDESTNLIIHGHNMKSGEMFGNLKLFRNEEYYKKHNIIYFDTLYENRQYEIVVVFLSQVYKKSDDVFKYYNFTHEFTEEEFDEFYRNIQERALFDTGIKAEFGDEFITLSTCSSHIENGRLVVVGKRIS